MRTLSFVERLELEFYNSKVAQQPLSLCQEAIALGDVDNDENNELMVGTVSGQLLIYKGSEVRPWKMYKDLGMITCVAIGNICNKGRNHGLVLSVDGWCHLFTVERNGDTAMASNGSTELQIFHKQHLHANSKVLMIADIDGDGSLEICVGFSDRVVRTFRWYHHADGKSGEIVALKKWALVAQIGSISMKCEAGKSAEIVVSQPGAAYVILKEDGQAVYHQSPVSDARSDSVFTELVGNVNTKDGQSYYALTTLDGTIMLIDNEGEKIYGIQVDHQLFGLTKLDITGDGIEEVIVCSWDGQTYIVNSNKQIARFQFDEPVAAFLAGHYSVGDDKDEACLIYVTFDGRIYIYHNIKLAHVQTFSLIEALENCEQVKQFMSRVGMDECSREEKRKLYQWCLYGRKPKLCDS